MANGDLRWSELQPVLEALGKRLDHIEEHLLQMGQAVGYSYTPMNAGIPPEVKELARSGKTLEAIKLYREATGAQLDEARAAVLSI